MMQSLSMGGWGADYSGGAGFYIRETRDFYAACQSKAVAVCQSTGLRRWERQVMGRGCIQALFLSPIQQTVGGDTSTPDMSCVEKFRYTIFGKVQG